MKKRWIVLGVVAVAAGALFLFNTSLLARPTGELTILAHRGVHQRFHTEGITNDTCTAARIYPPTHALLENTLPSIRAAFDAGADMVEIDIHPTTDGEFAVFHDWAVDCRTNGAGEIRAHSMDELRALDVGYGYTADGGQTFPFRGQGVGLIPSFREVLAAFPGRRFLINFKGNDPAEADAVVAYLDAIPDADVSRLTFYGGGETPNRLIELRPAWRVMSKSSSLDCVKGYVLTGWLGMIPETCRNTIVLAPANYAWIAWGWPNRFLQRMQSVDTDVYFAGPIPAGERLGIYGVDDAATFARIPRGWRGGVATNAVEVIGPLVRERR
jgi:glycerophosphoryl diester phosphodiesterase